MGSLPPAITPVGDIELFLQKHDDLGPASRQKLMAFFQDPEKTALLKIELASIIDG